MSIKNQRGNPWLKKIDAFVGIPLIFFVSLLMFPFRRIKAFLGRICINVQTTRTKSAGKIGIFIPGAIGDAVVLLPLLRQWINSLRPILFLSDTNKSIRFLFEPWCQVEVISIKNPLKAIYSVRSLGPYDLWIDCGQWARFNALISFFSNSKITRGFSTKGTCRHFLFDQVVIHHADVHESQNFSNLLAFPNKGSESESIELRKLKDLSQKNIMTKKSENRHLVFHMWAGGKNPAQKEWPLSYWKDLAFLWLSKDVQLILTGGPEDKAKTQDFSESLQNDFRWNPKFKLQIQSWVGNKNLSEVFSLLKTTADAVVSVNTGFLHLADLAGVPTIGLHGPTSKQRWGPAQLENQKLSLQSRLPCSPCLNLGYEFGCSERPCMESIEVEVVNEKLNYLFSISDSTN